MNSKCGFLIAIALSMPVPALAQNFDMTPAEQAQAAREKSRMGFNPRASAQKPVLNTYVEPKTRSKTKRLAPATPNATRSLTHRLGG